MSHCDKIISKYNINIRHSRVERLTRYQHGFFILSNTSHPGIQVVNLRKSSRRGTPENNSSPPIHGLRSVRQGGAGHMRNNQRISTSMGRVNKSLSELIEQQTSDAHNPDSERLKRQRLSVFANSLGVILQCNGKKFFFLHTKI
ncbi:hypothetical protein CEXT_242581 [Caerostris extrusa]|uniref:Uncharacterized protein n=1 Tax=Caerostris extrusa TaxID=172846 RepID=A0AAV4XTD0_CAEEX|nr:hypothetical protein CEXT_242581 [Caerostris extrusa]